MEAVFDDVLCPLINCPPATLRGRKQKLVYEGTALRTERIMSREWLLRSGARTNGCNSYLGSGMVGGAAEEMTVWI